MTAESESLAPEEMKAIETEASILMKHGIRLLYTEHDAKGALVQFDAARKLRSQLPKHIPTHAYALAACWLNRAEALTQEGPTGYFSALHAYNEALTILRSLPLAEDPRFGKRLVIACQNSALLLAALNPPRTKDAAAALREAIAVLDNNQGLKDCERNRLLTVSWMNLANVQAEASASLSEDEAWQSGQQALRFAKAFEQEDEVTAEAGLKARHILCRLLACRLERNDRDQNAMENVHLSTDLAEDGLELARNWKHRGVQSFGSVASDLFQFGARVYARYQPQFLTEYLDEHRTVAEQL